MEFAASDKLADCPFPQSQDWLQFLNAVNPDVHKRNLDPIIHMHPHYPDLRYRHNS